MLRRVQQPYVLRVLACCTLLALLAHAVVLYGIGKELAAFTSVLNQRVDPLFTRQIMQQAAQTPVSMPHTPKTPVFMEKIEENRAFELINSAQAATKTIADLEPPEITSTLAITTPEPITTSFEPRLTTLTASPSTVAGTSTEGLTVAGDWPTDTRLTYKLGGHFRGALFGSAQVQWTRERGTATTVTTAAPTPPENYQVSIKMQVGPIGVTMASQGSLGAQGLQPQAYEEQWLTSRRSVKLDAQAVILQNGQRILRPPASPWEVQDTASQFVELGHRFSSGQARLAEGETVRLWLARPGGLDEWVYDVGPLETVQLPLLGDVLAHRLKPRPLANPRGGISAEIWIAPKLLYLPIRIVITLNSETHIDLLVEKFEQR